jgi:hypothetical protein
VPLSTVGRIEPFSPEFQSMTLEKGAMIFHMLRWEIGDNAFLAFRAACLSNTPTNPSVPAISRTSPKRRANSSSRLLRPVDRRHRRARTFTDKYTVYRLGNNKGFRTIGFINQDLDLFRMPVELRIETDGKTVNQRIDVVRHRLAIRRRHLRPPPPHLHRSRQLGAQILARPRRPHRHPQRPAARRPGRSRRRARPNTRKALDANPQSSLASYRIGEVLFTQRNYQASRQQLPRRPPRRRRPRWTEVWSHIHIGRIFDVTGQRDRAVNEYRLAVQTNDNTQGAINEARMLLQKPYKRPDTG